MFDNSKPVELNVQIDDSSLKGCFQDTASERLDNLEKNYDKLKEQEFPTQFIFLNKSLNMSSGKAAAQCAHAVEELVFEIFTNASSDKRKEYRKYMSANPRAMIVLQVEDEEEMYKLNSYLESQQIWTGIYVDEMAGDKKFVPTAMAVEYLDRSEVRAKLLSGMFEKFTSVQELRSAHYKKTLEDIEAMALDSYMGRIFGSKDDMIAIYHKARLA